MERQRQFDLHAGAGLEQLDAQIKRYRDQQKSIPPNELARMSHQLKEILVRLDNESHGRPSWKVNELQKSTHPQKSTPVQRKARFKESLHSQKSAQGSFDWRARRKRRHEHHLAQIKQMEVASQKIKEEQARRGWNSTSHLPRSATQSPDITGRLRADSLHDELETTSRPWNKIRESSLERRSRPSRNSAKQHGDWAGDDVAAYWSQVLAFTRGALDYLNIHDNPDPCWLYRNLGRTFDALHAAVNQAQTIPVMTTQATHDMHLSQVRFDIIADRRARIMKGNRKCVTDKRTGQLEQNAKQLRRAYLRLKHSTRMKREEPDQSHLKRTYTRLSHSTIRMKRAEEQGGRGKLQQKIESQGQESNQQYEQRQGKRQQAQPDGSSTSSDSLQAHYRRSDDYKNSKGTDDRYVRKDQERTYNFQRGHVSDASTDWMHWYRWHDRTKHADEVNAELMYQLLTQQKSTSPSRKTIPRQTSIISQKTTQTQKGVQSQRSTREPQKASTKLQPKEDESLRTHHRRSDTQSKTLNGPSGRVSGEDLDPIAIEKHLDRLDASLQRLNQQHHIDHVKAVEMMEFLAKQQMPIQKGTVKGKLAGSNIGQRLQPFGGFFRNGLSREGMKELQIAKAVQATGKVAKSVLERARQRWIDRSLRRQQQKQGKENRKASESSVVPASKSSKSSSDV